MALWTPSQITTALWLDASDEATITDNLGSVSEWRDKSGNSNHVFRIYQGVSGMFRRHGGYTHTELVVVHNCEISDDFPIRPSLF